MPTEREIYWLTADKPDAELTQIAEKASIPQAGRLGDRDRRFANHGRQARSTSTRRLDVLFFLANPPTARGAADDRDDVPNGRTEFPVQRQKISGDLLV